MKLEQATHQERGCQCIWNFGAIANIKHWVV